MDTSSTLSRSVVIYNWCFTQTGWLSYRRLSTKLVQTFLDRGCHVVSAMDPHSNILDFLDWSRYYFFQVAPQLYLRGWVDPVPGSVLFRKSGSAGNRTRDLWICSHELWPLDYRRIVCSWAKATEFSLVYTNCTKFYHYHKALQHYIKIHSSDVWAIFMWDSMFSQRWLLILLSSGMGHCITLWMSSSWYSYSVNLSYICSCFELKIKFYWYSSFPQPSSWETQWNELLCRKVMWHVWHQISYGS
jgi:hypothetical protein